MVDFGQAYALPLATALPGQEITVVVEYPAGLHVQVQASGTAIEPRREEVDGKVRLTFVQPHAPAVDFGSPQPPEARRYPEVYVSTAKSWQEVARGYLALARPAMDAAALQPVRAQLQPASSGKRDVVAAALDWMHHHLRYTGLDFSNAGIVPHPVAQTLERGYGDCKDLAAFLVSLLEASGVEARIALVNASSWYDGPEDHAGLARFDHAIVYVPGLELWIDPTLRGMAPGVLADLATNRLALVIDESTTGPIRTPVGEAAANRAVIHTDVSLPETGKGTLRTVRTLTGTALSWTRQRATWRTADQVQREVGAEVQRKHGTDDFTYRHSDPLSARTPFEEILEVRGSNAAIAVDADAVVPLGFEAAIGLLPAALHEETDGPATDVFVGAPAELEIVNRVHVHPLYRLRGGPIEREASVGGVTWKYVVEPKADGAEARLQLRIDVRQVAAADLPEVRRSLQTLLEASNQLDFDNGPMRMLGEGQIAQAAAELRELERREPKNAWVQALLARTALASGLGSEAHRLARAAAKLQPGSAPVLRTLALVLAHDEWARPYHAGMDRKGAIEAIEKARKLEPDGTWSRQLLIELLARNDQGKIAGAGAQIEEALEQIRALRTTGDASEDDLYWALLWNERLDEELVRELEKKDPHHLLLAAKARKEGAAAALAWLDARGGGAREQLLAGAAMELFRAREYPVASELAAKVRDPRFVAMQTLLQRARKREASPLDLDRSLDVLVEAAAIAMEAQARTTPEAIGLGKEARESLARMMASVLERFPGSEEAMVDVVHSITEMREEEIPGVGILAISRTPMTGETYDLLQRSGGRLRIHPVQAPAARVAAAWKALADGKAERAAAWLDVHLRMGDDATLKAREAVIRERLRGTPADVAAAVALATLDVAARAAEVEKALAPAFRALPKAREQAFRIGSAYVDALIELERYDDALAAVDALAEQNVYNEAAQALHHRAWVLYKARRAAPLEALGARELERDRNSTAGYVFQAQAAMIRGDVEGWRAAYLAQADAGVQRESALNNAAWASLHLGVDDEAIRLAEQAIGPRADRPAAVDTLAVLLAEKGEVDRALRALTQLGTMRKDEARPGSSVRYARARIAEALGFREAAVALYRGVEPAEKSIDDLSGLAAKRLQALGAKK